MAASRVCALLEFKPASVSGMVASSEKPLACETCRNFRGGEKEEEEGWKGWSEVKWQKGEGEGGRAVLVLAERRGGGRRGGGGRGGGGGAEEERREERRGEKEGNENGEEKKRPRKF
mmetsp:Transcript_12937/g.45479  ORF Transcript_12937/g.45479 Transcript_12937/m.45479 type:complete len:117 (-) Transcript_12937:1882-2232(-)